MKIQKTLYIKKQDSKAFKSHRWAELAVLFAGSSKSHRDNSISFIFLESPHQVDLKNVVKSSKHFCVYFNTLTTHNDLMSWEKIIPEQNSKWY